MNRLTIFAKGIVDVRDTLHSLRLGGEIKWNGINEILRARPVPVLARIKHEIWTRSDQLLAAGRTIPPALEGRDRLLGAYTCASQYSRAVFETDADVIVLSILPDIASGLTRHIKDGFLFYAADRHTWPREDREWLARSFVPLNRLTVEESMENLARIVARIREKSSAPILVYNVSSVVPGERIHSFDGLDGDTYATRVRRFNLGLIELSQRTGISVVDVDDVVARGGADRLKYDVMHLTPEGCRAIAEEVVRILDDLGVLPTAAP